MDQILAEIRKIPPVTRFLVISSLAVTIPSLLNIVHPYKLVFTTGLAFKNLQIWRMYTSFFLSGWRAVPGLSRITKLAACQGGGLQYIFDLVTLYRTAEQLESGPYVRRSADMAWQLAWANLAIILVSLPLQPMIFFRPMLVALTYVGAALAPIGSQTSLMGLITLPVAYLPYIMILFDLLLGGPHAAALAICGAIVGHGWWWGVWGPDIAARGGVLSAYGRAPDIVRKWVGGERGPHPGGRNTGTRTGIQVTAPRRNIPVGGSGNSSASGSSTGYNWGSGQRLGS